MCHPTWVRNPQDAKDEHDWTRWFDEPTKYRDIHWNVSLDGVTHLALPSRGFKK